MTTLAPASTQQSVGQAQLLAQADTAAHAAVNHSGISVVNLVPGQSGTVKIQAGQHLSVRRPVKHGTEVRSEVPDNLIAIRRGDALNLRYADGSTLTIENFYAACTDTSVCSVNLASDSAAGIDFAANTSSGGVTTADGGTLVYAHGDHDILMSMAKDQSSLLATFADLGNAGVQTYLPHSSSLLPLLLVGAGALALAGNATGGSASSGIDPAATNAAQAQDAIQRAAEGNTATGTSPSESIYVLAGITGVDASNLAAINSALNSDPVIGASVNTKAKVQALVDAYKAILSEANGAADDATPGADPSASQYATIGANIGAASTDPENLSLLNSIVGAQSSNGVDSIREIEELARIANAVASQAAGTPGLTMAELTAIGITGVSALSPVNIQNVLNAIIGTPDNGTGVDTLAKLQALVNRSVDLTPPAAPTNAPLNYVDNVGTITSTTSTAPTTDDTTPGINIGALPAGVTGAVLYVDGILVPSTGAGTGVLTPTSPVTAGVLHTFGFGYVDAAGNISASSPTIAITVDTTPPAVPTNAPLNYVDNVGTIQNPISTAPTTDDTTPGINVGSLPAGVNGAVLYVDGILVPATYVASTGALTPDSPVTAGVLHTFGFGYVDAAGNTSASGPTIGITVDTTPPPVPTSAPSTYVDNVGTIQNPISTARTTDDTTPGINIGALPAGVNGAVLYVDGILVPATYVAGVLTPTSPVTAGVLHTFGFGYVDATGNTSASSPTINITVDTTPPPAAVITHYVDNVGTGLAAGNFSSGTTTDDTTPVLNGTISSGFDMVQIYEGATLLGIATSSDTEWVYHLPKLTDGSTHSYTAVAIDEAGNAGPASNAFTLAVSSPYERLSNANITGSLAGWTTNIPTGSSAIFQNNGSDGTVAFNTSGTSAGASVYQTVSNLIVGQSYTVQYQVQNSIGAASNTIVSTAHDGAIWNAGTQLATQTWAQDTLSATFHTYTFTATSNTATLVFTNTVASDTATSDLLLNQASIMTTDEVARHAATPLLLDLNGDGVKTVSAEHGVLFDVTNTNTVARTGWANANDALLVRDINLDGVINNGAELFGNGTLLADGSHAANGFSALAQFDTNHDGKIDTHDAVFQELKAWRDANGDGVSQANELLSLQNLGIASFNLSATEGNAVENGNVHGLISSYSTTDGASHELADVWFQQVIHPSAVM